MRILILLVLILFSLDSYPQKSDNKVKGMEYKKLTQEEERVILYKGTERPFTGIFNNHFEEGTYLCKRCGTPLYQSSDKFQSECGWPSFDDEIKGAVKRVPDKDGSRTEIVCSNCGAHLGHVFEGERLTSKNLRHCVNSVSLDFKPVKFVNMKNGTAIVAGGCFWGVEHYMMKMPGVISTEVGYIGGKKENPTYKDVCSHATGHAEAVKIVFDETKVSYEEILKMFFEIHDPTQVDRQGPDIGDQYRSEIFYNTDSEKATAEKLIDILREKGLDVATEVTKATTFWQAEDYHQQYYEKEGKLPYCHSYKKRF